jgi:hypothetical protein
MAQEIWDPPFVGSMQDMYRQAIVGIAEMYELMAIEHLASGLMLRFSISPQG